MKFRKASLWKVSTGPEGSFESRTYVSSLAAATARQPPPPLFELVLQVSSSRLSIASPPNRAPVRADHRSGRTGTESHHWRRPISQYLRSRSTDVRKAPPYVPSAAQYGRIPRLCFGYLQFADRRKQT